MPHDSTGPDPTIHRRRLRNELRRAREAANKTQRDVAAAMDWSTSKLIRIETGDVRVSTNDLRALLGYYGDDAAHVEALIVMARMAREPARWSLYRDVASPEYISFLGYESAAAIVRNFEPMLIPGLLQTEEYARAVIGSVEESDRVDALVDLRMQRQEVLAQGVDRQFHFIMDEAAIRRRVGGADVMRRQLRQLKDLGGQSNVTLRIVPLDHGMYPRMRVPYVLFEFESAEDEDVLFIENPLGDLMIRENSPQERGRITPVHYLGYFWQLEQIINTEDSEVILEDALRKAAGE